ncbi:bifunctional epoxide hydrolase 2-like [Apostichopus japonicus]|uniref:bifunctional epoxide hydrolase 2-like n=1 Tax=Stichopus japonicus TaxID=307972 RepID=UPI003AB7CCDE
MSWKGAVIFDLYGVIFKRPAGGISNYVKELGLPQYFLENVFASAEKPGDSFFRLERGELSVTQFCDQFERRCQTYAKQVDFKLPSSFSAQKLYFNFSHTFPDEEMLNAVAILKEKGIKICLLTNNFVDDTSYRGVSAQKFLPLRLIFDEIIESCRMGIRKPNPEIFLEACRRLQAKPNETVFLDDLRENVKAARKLGMKTILVKSSNQALRELKLMTGIDVLKKAIPVCIDPTKMSQCSITTKSSIKHHFFEMGQGPPIVLLHGFPEGWYSWRRQIPALVMSGYRVIAMEMKGYGESSCPPEVSEYSIENITKNLVSFLDALGLPQATFIGHDWGGHVAGSLALHYPERTFAVGSFNAPLNLTREDQNPLTILGQNPAGRAFLHYFQNKDLLSEFSGGLDSQIDSNRDGISLDWPNDLPNRTVYSAEELDYVLERMKISGIRGMLNWYRNANANQRWYSKVAGRQILCPALLVTSNSRDTLLTPQLGQHMEERIPNLTKGILQSGHWVLLEKPVEANEILINWLNKVHRNKFQLPSLL